MWPVRPVPVQPMHSVLAQTQLSWGQALALGAQGPAPDDSGGTVTLSEGALANLVGQVVDRVLTHHPAASGVSPAPRPRPRAAVPEVFASLGISADEYEQLSTYMKAVKMTPPDKWADDNGRDVGF